MALIYRSILEIEDPSSTFAERARSHAEAWLRWKLQDSTYALPEPGAPWSNDQGLEVAIAEASDAECAVVRISVYEGRRDDATQVKTTLTALQEPRHSWAWVDLERWSGHESVRWIPAPPGILTNLLRAETARRGALTLEQRAILVSDAAGALVADLVLDSSREIPLVAVSYNRNEENAVDVAVERGRELAKRLAGVAVVYVLGGGAVTAFSKAMHEAAGPDMDVHSGAIRTYLPAAGSDTDFPGRHRFVPFHKLEGRRADLASLIIAPPLLRGAVETPPPAVWRSSARGLLAASAGGTDYDALLEDADNEISELKGRADTLELLLADEREAVTNLARQLDDLGRRHRFLRGELRRRDPTAVDEPATPPFEPVLCQEVVEHAREHLGLVVIPEDVLDGAMALDVHADESWAPKAWLALQALEEYARAKAEGAFDGDFGTCCENSATDLVIPRSWIARNETKQTMDNPRFRELRRLPVSQEVEPSGRILMEQHIKLELGGSPSPRIHFHDDTRGSTGRIHIGWFGDHLDSRAKS